MLNEKVNPADYSNPGAVRLGAALVPGLAMTPISSVLGKSPKLINKRLQRMSSLSNRVSVSLSPGMGAVNFLAFEGW